MSGETSSEGRSEIPRIILGTRKESNEIAERTGLAEYRTVFEQFLPQLDNHPLLDSYSGVSSFSSEVDGREIDVTVPHLRRGKHAFVGMTTITNPDGTRFSSVIRNDLSRVEEYVQLVQEHPTALELLPEYYGSVGNWVVIERLYGLELQEVQDRLKQDSAFLELYTDNILNTILRTAKDDLKLADVAFIDGWNVMVDPETAQPRLVEQTNLEMNSFYNENELITGQLFRELLLAQSRVPETVPLSYPMRLMQKAFDVISPREIYMRPKVITPTHEDYEYRYEMIYGEKLSAEEFELRSEHEEESIYHLPDFQGDYAEILSDAFITSVQSNDEAALEAILETNSVTRFLTDATDPRSVPIVFHIDSWR